MPPLLQVTTTAAVMKLVELDPQFENHHLLPPTCVGASSAAKREAEAAWDKWVKKASTAWYRISKRRKLVAGAIASAGKRGPEDPAAEMDAFEERIRSKRKLQDGSSIPPKRICAFDQSPMTR